MVVLANAHGAVAILGLEIFFPEVGRFENVTVGVDDAGKRDARQILGSHGEASLAKDVQVSTTFYHLRRRSLKSERLETRRRRR